MYSGDPNAPVRANQAPDEPANALKAQVSVGPKDAYGRRAVAVQIGESRHRDRLVLDAADKRKAFVSAAAKLFGLDDEQSNALEQELLSQLDVTAADAPATPEQLLAQTPSAVIAAAEQFLRNPRIIEELARDFEVLGIVGEVLTALTVYLVGVSRLLSRPLSVVLQSASSAGKSMVASCVLSLFPDESLVKATDITANALYYLPPGSLEHKVVFRSERKHVNKNNAADAANATMAIRELISSGELTKVVTTSDPNGGMITRKYHQEGPIAYVETTTEVAIFDEDINRMLVLAMDESSEQTARIAQHQALAAAGHGRAADRRAIVEKHHAAQRMLQMPKQVIIPYAPALTLPTDCVATRRAFPQLLGMISAVAILRQRQKAPSEALIADLQDYAIAYELMLPLLRRRFQSISDGSRQLVEAIASTLAWQPFTRRDCKRLLGISMTAVRKRIDELEDAGLIARLQQVGVAYSYRLLISDQQSSDVVPGLPRPDELAQQLAGAGQAAVSNP